MQTEPNLMEWDYGNYEGLTTAEIKKEHPHWNVFRDGCPGGETTNDISARADRFITHLKKYKGNTLLFSHGHILRVITARWLQLSAEDGSLFVLKPTSLSILSYEHNLQEPVITLWNDNTPTT